MPTNAGPSPTKVDNKLQMKLLDLMPLQFKQVIWAAPVSIDIRQAQTILNQCRRKKEDINKACERLISALMYEYPNWSM